MAANSLDLTQDPKAMIATRVYDAPRTLVWQAWTDPKHLAQWWGPDGFTTTTGSFDMRPGGNRTRLTVHAVFPSAAERDRVVKEYGAEVGMLMRFKESPEPPQPGMVPPGSENKVMHAALRIGDTVVFASDGHAKGQPKFEGFSLSVDAKDEADADRKFAALGEGGQVRMPLAETFFAKSFGMVADKFGVGWMIIAGPKNP